MSLSSVRKRLGAFLLSLVLCLSLIPAAQAASYTNANTLAADMQAANDYWNNTLHAPWNYSNASGCTAYSHYMFTSLYGHTAGTSVSNNTVSYFHVTSAAELASVITKNARIGDAVRVSACTSASDNSGSGTNTHVFILYSASQSGVVRYESNVSNSQTGRRSTVSYDYIVSNDVDGYSVNSSGVFNNGKILLVKIIHAKENNATGSVSGTGSSGASGSTVTVTNTSAAKVSDTSYKLAGQLTIPSDKKVTECGVYLGTSNNPTTVAGKDLVSYSGRSVSMWYTVSGLNPGTTYYYRFYAKASGVSTPYYSSSGSFTTPGAAAHAHSYNSEGVCTICGASYPLSITALNQKMTVTAVNSSGAAPSHSTPYGSAKVVTSYSLKDTVTVVGKATNSYGNLWYKLSDGSWIFSDYLSAVQTQTTPSFTVTTTGADGISASGATVRGSCTVPSGVSIKTAGVRLGTSSSSLSAVAWDTGLSYTNRSFNIWFELPAELDVSYSFKAGTTYYFQIYAVDSNGNENVGAVKSFTIPATHTHSYNSVGVCTTCGASYPLNITSLNQKMTVSSVNSSGTAPSHSSPYGDATIGTRYYKDDVVTVVGKATNSYGNLWYKLSDGSWITSSYLSTHLHTFEGAGKCSSCGQYYTLHTTTVNRSAVITALNSSSQTAPSHSSPYGDAQVKTRYKLGDTVYVTCQAKNAYGNLWYQLSNGEWLVSSYVTLK